MSVEWKWNEVLSLPQVLDAPGVQDALASLKGGRLVTAVLPQHDYTIANAEGIEIPLWKRGTILKWLEGVQRDRS